MMTKSVVMRHTYTHISIVSIHPFVRSSVRSHMFFSHCLQFFRLRKANKIKKNYVEVLSTDTQFFLPSFNFSAILILSFLFSLQFILCSVSWKLYHKCWVNELSTILLMRLMMMMMWMTIINLLDSLWIYHVNDIWKDMP